MTSQMLLIFLIAATVLVVFGLILLFWFPVLGTIPPTFACCPLNWCRMLSYLSISSRVKCPQNIVSHLHFHENQEREVFMQ